MLNMTANEFKTKLGIYVMLVFVFFRCVILLGHDSSIKVNL